MPDNIRQSVATARPVVDGIVWRDDMHSIISRYAKTLLYTSTKSTARLRKEVLTYYTNEVIRQANLTGLKTAEPILKALGSPIEAVRGKALRRLATWTANNVKAFRQELNLAKVVLDGETQAAFFRATRDDVGRKTLVDSLTKANRDDMAAIRKANNRIRSARTKLAKAEKVGNSATVKAARLEMTKARAARATKSMLGRFEEQIQAATRDSVRRQIARSRKAAFEQAYGVGVKRTWVAVNGSGACPQCDERHGLICPSETGGEPGSGQTYCQSSCMCQAVPEKYLVGNPIPEPIVA